MFGIFFEVESAIGDFLLLLVLLRDKIDCGTLAGRNGLSYGAPSLFYDILGTDMVALV